MTGRALAALALLAGTARAEPLALLAPPPGDDARLAVALGPHGEVYAPDGKGAWVRSDRSSTVDELTVVGRAGNNVVAAGDGVVYKLAPNGWTAIRLHQKDKATLAWGSHAIAAVKRQLYALDRSERGEPAKLALAPAPIVALGAGKTIVIATDRGLARVTGKAIAPIPRAPRQVLRLIDDRWALAADGLWDLDAGKRIATPAGFRVAAATRAGGDVVAIATRGTTAELWRVHDGELTRAPLAVDPPSSAVGVAADRAGRIVVALADGRLLVRAREAWTTTTVRTLPATPRPGPGPATSP